MLIVLDTNVIASGIFWHGLPEKILNSWKNQQFDIILTQEILQEYEEVLYQISNHQHDQLIYEWLTLFSENAQIINININNKISLCRDPDDDKFLECAISGNAQYIVTGDSDLLILNTKIPIQIIKPVEFIKLLK